MGVWKPRYRKPTWLKPGLINPFPKTDRDHMINELHELGYLVPGAEELALSQLRDILQACREKKAKQDEADAAVGEEIFDNMDPEARRQAMKDFVVWRNKRRGGN